MRWMHTSEAFRHCVVWLVRRETERQQQQPTSRMGVAGISTAMASWQSRIRLIFLFFSSVDTMVSESNPPPKKEG